MSKVNTVVRGNQTGFTLIEILIAMAISLIVSGGIYSAFSNQKEAYALQKKITEMGQNLRVTMDFITRDLRNAGYNPTGNLTIGSTVGLVPGGAPNIAIDTSSIRILSDLIGSGGDGDGDTGDQNEEVTYSFVDSDGDAVNDRIVKNGVTNPLADNITALTFIYYDSSGSMIATPVTGANLTNIRAVQVSITAQTSTGERTRTLRAMVRTRNIGLQER